MVPTISSFLSRICLTRPFLIGKSGAIFYGFPDTTQDADLFPSKTKENCRKIALALDGIETFAEAKARSVLVDGRFPVASLDDIIKSKRAANRQKDRESLPRLEAFAEYLKLQRK